MIINFKQVGGSSHDFMNDVANKLGTEPTYENLERYLSWYEDGDTMVYTFKAVLISSKEEQSRLDNIDLVDRIKEISND
jgi:hypothetical protein